jgi:hypothetical protein
VPFCINSWTENEGNSGGDNKVGSGDEFSAVGGVGCQTGTKVNICESAAEAAVRVSKDLECKYGMI